MGTDRHSRQSFLGEDSEKIIRETRIGIVGLGGGGSHVAQQLAHIGFRHFVLYDADVIEDSNLNRLVGGTEMDVAMVLPKVMIAERLIRGIVRDPVIERFQDRWQEKPLALRSCDLLFGNVDGLRQRWELQVFSRRFCIPYIDIGLDVVEIDEDGPKMRGQVIATVPGGPCMKCIHFLTDEDLDLEGARYGSAGIRPQVVWANGILASAAVGIGVDLLMTWTRSTPPQYVIYLSYDGNLGTLKPDPRLKYIKAGQCVHFDAGEVGEPVLTPL